MKKLLLTILLVLPLSLFAQEQTSKDSLSIIQRVEQWYDANMNYARYYTFDDHWEFVYSISIWNSYSTSSLCCQQTDDLNIFLVVLFGTLGAIIGALINYYLALWLGRPIIYKFADSKLGHLCLLSSEKIKKTKIILTTMEEYPLLSVVWFLVFDN